MTTVSTVTTVARTRDRPIAGTEVDELLRIDEVAEPGQREPVHGKRQAAERRLESENEDRHERPEQHKRRTPRRPGP